MNIGDRKTDNYFRCSWRRFSIKEREQLGLNHQKPTKFVQP